MSNMVLRDASASKNSNHIDYFWWVAHFQLKWIKWLWGFPEIEADLYDQQPILPFSLTKWSNIIYGGRWWDFQDIKLRFMSGAPPSTLQAHYLGNFLNTECILKIQYLQKMLQSLPELRYQAYLTLKIGRFSCPPELQIKLINSCWCETMVSKGKV